MAIEFRAETPIAQQFRGIDILRAPQTGKVGGIITSVNPTCVATHFWNQRTIPHDTDSCAACEAGRRKQWHVYVGLWQSETKTHFLFECTDYAGIPLHELWKRSHDLRGVALTASRRADRKNAKVVIALNELCRGRYAIPNPLDVPKILAHIWGICAATNTIVDRLDEDRERRLSFHHTDNGTEH